MLNNKEVLGRIEKMLLDFADSTFADSTNDFNDYANKVEEFVDVITIKTGLYKELIYLWLDEKVELKESDLKKIDDYLNIIENKKNCVNLLTAIVKGYVHIKFDLDDKFTHDFIENICDSAKLGGEIDGEDGRLNRISIEVYNNEEIGVRDVLFVMSYINIEGEYDDILKKVMVYKVERN